MPTDSENLQRIADELTMIRSRLGFPNPSVPPPPPPPPPPTSGLARTRAFGAVQVTGVFADTDRPHVIRVAVGQTLSWTGGVGRHSAAANGRLPFAATELTDGLIPGEAANCTNHPEDATNSVSFLIAATRVLVAGLPLATDPASSIYRLRDVVLIECGQEPALPALYPWPIVDNVFAWSEDVDAFLASTDVVPEWVEGWTARYLHARNNFGSGEDGYGGELAERSGFGALLLCSNLPAWQKQRVQDRFVRMARDLEAYGCRYPANGGHGVGRYIVWLIGRLVGATPLTAFSGAGFSELQQVVPYAGAGALSGYGFRPNAASAVDMANDYCECCTACRWAGGAFLAHAVPALVADSSWMAYTEAYLRDRAAKYPAGHLQRWRVARHGRTLEILQLAMGL